MHVQHVVDCGTLLCVRVKISKLLRVKVKISDVKASVNKHACRTLESLFSREKNVSAHDE